MKYVPWACILALSLSILTLAFCWVFNIGIFTKQAALGVIVPVNTDPYRYAICIQKGSELDFISPALQNNPRRD